MKEQSHEKYGIAFGLGFVSLMVILVPLLCINQGYFIYYGDFVSQQLPFYALANDAVRSGGLTGWNWFTDLGSSFLGSYAFYLTGSPFFWMTVILPKSWVLYAIPWLLCLKHGLASMTAYAYIRHFVQNQNAAVIGGLLYAYSGFQLFNLFFNHFQDVTAFFPLMLIAMEQLIQHHRKGWFAACVALMAVINYFFFAGQVVFLILYFLIRLSDQDFPVTVKKFFALAIEAIIGVGIACAVLLPAALAVLDNSRVTEYLFGQDMLLYSDRTRIIRILQSFFMIPDAPARTNLFSSKNAKWASIGGYFPLFSMAGVLAFLKQKKKHWASKLIIICMICAFVPVLNSAFYLFNAAYYARWYYMPLLIMAMMTAYVLDNREISMKQGFQICGVMLGLFGLMALLPTKSEDHIQFFHMPTIPVYFWITWLISVICLLGGCYICYLRKRKRPFLMLGMLFTTVACIACTGSIVYFGKAIGTDAKSYIREGIHGKEHLSISYDHADYFRTDISKDYDNYPMFWGLSSMRCFQSVVSPSIMEFYHNIGITRDVASRAEQEHYTLRGLFSVKYYFSKINAETQEEKEKCDMPGFSYDRTENEFAIYHNDYFIPMGFPYDTYILTDAFDKMQDATKEKLLIHALILSPEQAERYQDILLEMDHPETSALSKASYLEACAAHAEHACQNFQYDAKGFSAEITLEKPELLFFSVPFDKGWSAQVNGKPVQIENVSGGFMAIPCETGQNQIVFSYTLPGLKIGICLTLAGVIALILYLLIPFPGVETKQAQNQNYLSAGGVRAADAYTKHVLNYIQNQKGDSHEYRTSERNKT